MFERRKKYQPIKKRQKIVTGLFVSLLFFGGIQHSAYGQNFHQKLEISEYDDLPTLVSRKTHIDDEGSVWVGTDAGMRVYPNNQPVKDKICRSLKKYQVWGIESSERNIYVGTYDSGMYIFDRNSGAIIKKIPFEKAKRIRRLKKIDEVIYALHSEGIWAIKGDSIYPYIEGNPKVWSRKKAPFPIDIFKWNNQVLIAYYRGYTLFQRGRQNQPVIEPHITEFMPEESSKRFLQVLSGVAFKDKLILGATQNRIAVYDSTGIRMIELRSKYDRFLTSWDMDTDGENLYIAIGNNKNLNEGACLKVSENDLTQNFIWVKETQIQNFAWTVTVDPKNQGIWSSTLTKGVYFRPQYENWIAAPTAFEQFTATADFILVWNNQHVYLKKHDRPTWIKLKKNIKPLQFIQWRKELYAIGIEGLYKYDSTNNDFVKKVKGDFSEVLSTQDGLYIRTLFGPLGFYDPISEKHQKQVYDGTWGVTNMTTYQNEIIYQLENQGFFHLSQGKPVRFTTDFESDFYKTRIFFLGNNLIFQFGTSLRICHIDFEKHSISTLKEINLSDYIKETKISFVYSNPFGLWVGNGQYVYRFSIDTDLWSPVLIDHFYLGATSDYKDKTIIIDKKAYKKVNGYIQIQLLNKANSLLETNEFEVKINGSQISYRHKVARVNDNEFLSFEVRSPDYFFSEHGYIPLFISQDSHWISRTFIPVKKKKLINYPYGIYQIEFGTKRKVIKTLFRISKSIFKSPGFWLLSLFSLFLLAVVLFQSQTEKVALSQKISDLQMNTLKSNMNPHFIFNIMNLIQAMIVKSEKKKALEATSELGKLNRLFLETSNKELISLEDEIDYCERYMALEALRFEGEQAFVFSLDIEENLNLRSWQIPPLILQPLLENAVKHGSAHQNNIRLNASLDKPHILKITIENDLSESKSEKNTISTQMGMSLVRERLDMMNERYSDILSASFSRVILGNTYNVIIEIRQVSQDWIYN